MTAQIPIVAGQTMFDEIPFAKVTDNNASPVTDQSTIMSATPPKSVVDGTYELLYSSGKVAADAALASMRSIWSVLTGPATAAFDKVSGTSQDMDPLAKPAGPGNIQRAGADGASVIANWVGILSDDAKIAGQKIKSGISTVGAEVKNDATSGLQYITGGVQNSLSWAGKVTGSTIGSIFSGLGVGGSSVVILIVMGVIVFFLYPYAAPTLAARAARS